jgi:hypothetical protein
MVRLLASPRRRRRLARLSIVALLAAATSLLIVFVRNTGESFETPLRNELAQTYVEPKTVELTADALRAARLTAYQFVRTAVAREHLAESWALAHPTLRQGMTRSEWEKGDIPIIPYPANLKKLGYRVEYSYPNVLSMAVRLEPKRGFDNGPMTFAIELRKAGTGNKAHWLVSQWTPVGLSISGGRAAGRPSTPRAAPEPPLSAIWLLIPAMVFVAMLAVPAVVLTRNWRRGRRAERAYRAQHGL